MAEHGEGQGVAAATVTASGSTTTAEGTALVPVAALPFQSIPEFVPGQTDPEEYATKLQFVAMLWPPQHYSHLVSRAVLNLRGTAFDQAALKPELVATQDETALKNIVAMVGGSWGKTALAEKYEIVEKAIFQLQQISDESADSYLARSDVIWAKMLRKNLTLAELQSYVLLRGSKLREEDRRRVVTDSGGTLELAKVRAEVRSLGSKFFQQITGGARGKEAKTYDVQAAEAMMASAEDSPALVTNDYDNDDLEQMTEEDMIAMMCEEQCEDGLLVTQFEEAIIDTLQGDAELAPAFNAYTEARKRLAERARNRGFWPVQSNSGGKSSGKHKSKSKNKNKGGVLSRNWSAGRKSLAQRIATSAC